MKGYFPQNEDKSSIGSGRDLSVIKIEPNKVTDHHQKNFYNEKYKSPAEFKYL